jgi:hypothetical protein
MPLKKKGVALAYHPPNERLRFSNFAIACVAASVAGHEDRTDQTWEKSSYQ